jgi:ATP-dependent Clp protease adaptor protein ClpS
MTAPIELDDPRTEGLVVSDTPWITIVWNDPINTIEYVVFVFQQYFNYPKPRAERLTRDVDQKGKAVVSHGTREQMERDVQAMHEFGLWATLEKQS